MNILIITLALVASFLVGFWFGYLKGALDFNKIIDTYKETVNIYRKQLGLE